MVMHLVEDLDYRRHLEPSPVLSRLLTDDVARLDQAARLAEAEPDPRAFVAAARCLGWSPRGELVKALRPTLDPFLEAFHAYVRDGRDDRGDRTCHRLWERFEADRFEHLMGCLSPARRNHG